MLNWIDLLLFLTHVDQYGKKKKKKLAMNKQTKIPKTLKTLNLFVCVDRRIDKKK